MYSNLSPGINQRIAEQQKGGVNIRKLAPGIKVIVETKNSTYTLEHLEDGKVLVQGGKYFPEFTETIFGGSTWRGSILKIGWIGQGMHMELGHPTQPGVVTTTAVQSAKVIGPDWEYTLWGEPERSIE